MNNDRKRKIRSATAGILAVAILISGTFAWNAFDQEALNEINGQAKDAGARLHDDFDGSNKDVYIENYADQGGELVFARIRLDEYMEIGTGAGTGGTDLEVLRGDKEKTAGNIPVVDDVTTWDTYLYGTTADGSEQIRKYRDLAFGGSTIYMPTFNKHIYNLEADINGTLRGPDGDPLTDADAYLDYTTYSNGQSVTADAKYATDDQDENNQRPNDYVSVSETHVAKPTLTSTVMSMEQWKTNGSKPGPYWVYDVDGWAYWAQGIEPQTATGLLLTGITVVEDPEEEWFYAVNVVSQMATAGDWGTEEGKDGFYEDGITSDGEHLLTQLTASMNLIVPGNVTEVQAEAPLQLTSKVVGLKDKSVTWTVTGGTGSTSISDTGLLTIDERQEGGSTITVRVQSNGLSTLFKEKTFRVTPTFKNVTAGSNVTVSADNINWYVLDRKVENGQEKVMIFSSTVVCYHVFNASSANSDWSVSQLRSFMNGSFINTYLPTLKKQIIDTTLKTAVGTNTSGSYKTTVDKVFPLTVEDLGFTSSPADYSYPTQPNALVSKNKVPTPNEYQWTRSPNNAQTIKHIYPTGYHMGAGPTNNHSGVRPALWINI